MYTLCSVQHGVDVGRKVYLIKWNVQALKEVSKELFLDCAE